MDIVAEVTGVKAGDRVSITAAFDSGEVLVIQRSVPKGSPRQPVKIRWKPVDLPAATQSVTVNITLTPKRGPVDVEGATGNLYHNPDGVETGTVVIIDEQFQPSEPSQATENRQAASAPGSDLAVEGVTSEERALAAVGAVVVQAAPAIRRVLDTH